MKYHTFVLHFQRAVKKVYALWHTELKNIDDITIVFIQMRCHSTIYLHLHLLLYNTCIYNIHVYHINNALFCSNMLKHFYSWKALSFMAPIFWYSEESF